MTTHYSRSIAAAAIGLAGCLLLAACGSTTSTRAAPPATNPTSSATSSSPAAADSTTAPVGGNASAAPVGGTSACALVTEPDATTALGKDPGAGSKFSSHGSTQCQYGSYQTAFLLVNLTPSQGRAGYDNVHNNPKLGQNVRVIDITGVGDRAFEISGPNTAGIYFTKGDALVVVSVSMQTATSPPKVAALALAKIAASRL